MDQWTFYVGQRVKRLSDVFNPKSKMLCGEVIERYSRGVKDYGNDLILGPYPELYLVRWDDGKESEYLPHGIEAMTHEEIMEQIESKIGLG